MTRPVEPRVRSKPPRRRSGGSDRRTRIVSLLMLAAILGVIVLGIALLVFILRDLWVFIVTMMQPG